MAESKYGKYIIREPLEKGRAPSLHICGEQGCEGADLPNFPVEVQLLVVTEPIAFPHPAHAHDGDEIFFIFGTGNDNIDTRLERVTGFKINTVITAVEYVCIKSVFIVEMKIFDGGFNINAFRRPFFGKI